MRTDRLSLAPLLTSLILFGLPAVGCDEASRRGGGGSGGDDDASGDDDDGGEDTIPQALRVIAHVEIEPSETGTAFGLSACSADITSEVTFDPAVSGCESCAGAWTGPVVSSSTNCSGSSTASSSTYGFLWLGVSGIDVWSFSEPDDEDPGGWSHNATAAPTGAGSWYVEYDELMGDESFDLGLMYNELTLESMD